MRSEKSNKIFRAVAGMVTLLVSVLIIVYLLTSVFPIIPVQFSKFVNATFVAIILYLIIRIILSFLRRYLQKFVSVSEIHPILFLASIFGYFILGVSVLGTLGINVSSIILGGSLITVIIGLASQTVLANQFAGILLTIVRPFKVGDFVTLNTWQYGGTFPVVFPKYFSVDRIEATAYTGKVVDVTINYTVLDLTSGDRVKLPNGIIVQSAVIIRKPGIVVKARYEIPKYINFEDARPKIIRLVESLADYQGDLHVSIDETTLNTYIVMIVAKFRVMNADLKRGEIFEGLMKLIEPMKTDR
ncbi:MAG: mechanosensitive ion channel family protein [Candidatus Thermoplasmatota archaeon]|nr:mechanosensitive ion channel family protein [Candidatus Thermoplasmatota archaeon]